MPSPYDSYSANFQIAPTDITIEDVTVTDKSIEKLVTIIPQNVIPSAAIVSNLPVHTSNIIFRVGSVAGPYSLNSILAQPDGTTVRVTNFSGGTLTLINEDLTVTNAATRLAISTGANLILAANTSVLLSYDLSRQRWVSL
jgi:hypothetical protein